MYYQEKTFYGSQSFFFSRNMNITGTHFSDHRRLLFSLFEISALKNIYS